MNRAAVEHRAETRDEPVDFLLDRVIRPAEEGAEVARKEFADTLDQADEIKDLREEFLFPRTEETAKIRKPGTRSVYLCGNSLGLQPRRTREYVTKELDRWAELGVEGHFRGGNPWVTVDETPIDAMARVVGAKPVEVAVMNSLTVNLHLMMVPFYRPTSDRFKILIEGKAFPSDHHAVESQIRFHGFDPHEALVEIFPREGEDTLRSEDIVATIRRHGSSMALVLLSGVQYYTGQCFDMRLLTEVGHEVGAKVGFDLAHAVGNVPMELHAWGPDFACWCSYKYLNAGPGSLGGCFVHERHAEDHSLMRFAGWWGHRKEDRFLMRPDFIPQPGAMGFQLSNPAVLPMAAVVASLELFDRATMRGLRRKSLALTGYLERLLAERLPDVRITTPDDISERGCQLSLEMPVPVREVYRRLQEESVIVDKREPSAIRVAPAPLYNNFTDVLEFVETLEKVLKEIGDASAA